MLFYTTQNLPLKFLHWLIQQKDASGPKMGLWTRINLAQKDVSLHDPENTLFVKLYTNLPLKSIPFVIKGP